MVLAVCVFNVVAMVPFAVSGEFVTVKIEGIVIPTLLRKPLDGTQVGTPAAVVVKIEDAVAFASCVVVIVALAILAAVTALAARSVVTTAPVLMFSTPALEIVASPLIVTGVGTAPAPTPTHILPSARLAVGLVA